MRVTRADFTLNGGSMRTRELWMLAALTILGTDLLAQAALTREHLAAFRFRSVGPAVTGGRIHDVEALPDDPATIYVATASGGLWKTTNKGTTWTPIFEGQATSTFGDIAIAPSNRDVVWAGTGEQQNRQSTSWGNGMYRSIDAGRTWRHLGLVETRHIGRVVVHPTNPNLAYVAALGNLWKASPDRGVYKTADGGETWQKVLFVDTLTGVVDLVMDPADPNTLYAAAYQRQRRTWGFNGGGSGSGIYKTTDAGGTWAQLTTGIPTGPKGRIGLAISPTNPRILNALIEHGDSSGTFRSTDGGATWRRMSRLNPRPMYYSHIHIDPTNADRVYVLATNFYKSEDGGGTFDELPYRATYDVGVHSDFHALWIDPSRPKHFYLAGDGGFYETWDMGQTYEKLNNFAIGQFYGIGVDMRDPYWIYGGMQDNHSWMGPSATRHWTGIINDDWRQIGFGDGMYWQPDPTSHRYVYGNSQNGGYSRLDAETGDRLDIRPLEPEGEDYRWDWVSPSLVSRHDPTVVYVGGNRLFISRDRGVSWDRTEDLTRQMDRDTLRIMGVKGAEVTLSRNDGTSSYGEIVTIAESPLDPAILWVGTDDGNVQVSRDGGRLWTEVGRNVRGVTRGTYVSRVVASRAAPGTAWVTFDAHRDGDFRPYVFGTTDFGRTWTARTEGLPADGSANVIVEHPDNPSTLFLGTEHGLFATMDAGRRWMQFPGVPTTLYDDLVIHPRERDLVVGTHGRSILVLDDTRPLAEWSSAIAARGAHVFSIRPAPIFQYWKDTSYRGQAAYAGENPPFGAIITYWVQTQANGARMSVTNAEGRVVRSLEVTGAAGLHRAVWDLRYAPPEGPPFGAGASTTMLPQPVGPRGPFVSPGEYTVTLEAGTHRATATVTVRGDPEMPITQQQWIDRESFLVALQQLQNRAYGEWLRLGDSGSEALREDLQAIRRGAASIAGDYNGSGVQQGSLYPPTHTHREAFERLGRRLDAVLDKLP